jgi:hypothetical protein
MNYEIDVIIDETALDVEWLNQAPLAIKYGEFWAQKTMELSKLEEQLKIKCADLTDYINQNPSETLGADVKPTVGNIESYLVRDKSVIKLKEDIRKTQYDVNMAVIAKIEISNTRKTALENLVKLHGQNYFAGPTMPRNLTEEKQYKEQLQKKVDGGVATKLARNKPKF